jgi:hypothetical protein
LCVLQNHAIDTIKLDYFSREYTFAVNLGRLERTAMPRSLLSQLRQTSALVNRLPSSIDRPPEPGPMATSQRIALWELENSLQCSIIGTCLSDQDLLAAIRKHRLPFDRNARSYDIHSYCVRATNHDCGLARSLNKLLERKYGGALRLLARAKTVDDMQALWQRLRDSGQIAAGYWAVMSLKHTPISLKTQVFGEVHMLSHLHGHGASQLATRLSDVERRCSDLEARLRRSEISKLEALEERDAARAALGSRAAAQQPSVITRSDVRELRRLQQKLAKCERALIITRARARQAESEIKCAAASQMGLRKTRREGTSSSLMAAAVVRSRAAPVPTEHRILYIGGRTAVVPHLRAAATARVAAFYHHDGGIEDSLHRIEELIERCDAVVCPVDCVSHGACRLAKAICQRLRRRFLPIPTASRSGFERALDQLAAELGVRHNESAAQ